MKFLNVVIAPIAAMLMGLAAGSAGAVDFDFYKLGHGAGDFLPTDGFSCSGGDLCSSNIVSVLNGDLTFTIGSLTATATGTYNGNVAAVVQDHEPNWIDPRNVLGAGTGAGLGVYHVNNDTSDDNITAHEMLTVKFSQSVRLTAIGLANEGHQIDTWAAGKTFLFNGSSTLLPSGPAISGLNMVGTEFTFAYGGGNADQFYLSSMTVTPVPEPEIYAMLGLGLGLLGWVGRRRKLQTA